MIGVISQGLQERTVRELFELFKTPWGFYKTGVHYDVLLVSGDYLPDTTAKLVVVHGSEETAFDRANGIGKTFSGKGAVLEYEDKCFPVYGSVATFKTAGRSIVRLHDSDDAAALEIDHDGRRIVRLGYDLFEEVEFLLSHGQPSRYAMVPTLEMHISLLRNAIVDSGIQLIEIPPVPVGYSFAVCLTHDVDFMGIRDHKLDKSVAGFILRSLFPRIRRDIHGKITWSRFLRNWKALLSLPAVLLGLGRDIWFDLDRYSDLEKDKPSTFYFIPFKDRSGQTASGMAPKLRAARYDVRAHKDLIKSLVDKGHEIGLHGLDAWLDSQMGSEERKAIREVTGEDPVGLRMHWLYFDVSSPLMLEQAGFLYDSTLGYNDAVGFRSGTTQVFRLPETSSVFELPLNVMDTTMFYPDRMGLSETEALRLCRKLIDEMRTYSGVLTINWHTRSLSPERNWDDFYLELLKSLEKEKVWFAKAGDVVKWFLRRRNVSFDDMEVMDDKIRLRLGGDQGDRELSENSLLPLCIRVYSPQAGPRNTKEKSPSRSFIDLPWNGENHACFPI